jgi:hypothetical protein
LIAATYPPEGGRLKLAAIDGRRKVAVDETGARHAFDLIADPHEQRDLVAAGSADEAFEALLGIASAELASAADVESLDLATLTDDERDRLRALGYLHGSP